MKCIDFEAHYYPYEFMPVMAKRTQTPRIDLEKDVIYYSDPEGYLPWRIMAGPDDRNFVDCELRIRNMDASGVDMQVLSAAQGIEALPKEDSIALAKAANKYVFEAMQKYPGRFQGMAALPLIDVEASLKELEICAKEYGFIGMNLFSNLGNGNYPDDDKYEPLFEMADKLGLFVYLHPSFSEIDRLHGAGTQLLTAALGFGVDTLITFARLLAKGIFDRYPNLKIMMGHFGEGIPFLYDRFHNHSHSAEKSAFLRGSAKNQHKFGHYIQNNLYVTSSGMTSYGVYQLTKEVLGVDKILFGSDYPFERTHTEMKWYINSLPIEEAERALILGGNAQRLFGL